MSDPFNGIIALVIGKLTADKSLLLDTWLMSCRVLGRQVELATLNVLVDRARRMGASALLGRFRPTAKNSMVKEHYARLGFQLSGEIDGKPLAARRRRPEGEAPPPGMPAYPRPEASRRRSRRS